ncbi:hypothetical protein HKX48_004723 [Thoreauomyces humboldtii]|nr:hypothetical protein HKX48_004723 [Thoreauomyces humboldtii]
MDATQPLSTAEIAWIAELKALRRAFAEKMQPFKEKVEAELRNLHQRQNLLREQRDGQYASARAPGLGDLQRRRIEAALKQEYTLLVTATQKVTRLKERLREVREGAGQSFKHA